VVKPSKLRCQLTRESGPCRVTLLISLGLHGIVLLIPLRREPALENNAESEQVRWIELPAAPSPEIGFLPSSSNTKTTFDEIPPDSEPLLVPESRPQSLPDLATIDLQNPPTPEAIPKPLPTPMPLSDHLEQGIEDLFSAPLLTTRTSETEVAASESPVLGESQVFMALLQEHPDRFGEHWSLQEILEFFGEPGQAEQLLDHNQQPLSQIEAYHLFPEKTPQEILEEIVLLELTEQQDFDVQPIAHLGGGMIYEIHKNQESTLYANIVPLNPGSGSLLVIFSTLPD
jgi:hypothetical protein